MSTDLDTPAPQPAVVTTVAIQAEPAPPAGRGANADLPRTTLGVFFMIGLAAAALWIVRPFLPAIVWATMIVVALWPVMLRLQARLRGKRWAAVSGMTLGLLLAFVVPFSLAVAVIAEHTEDIGAWAQSLRDANLPAAPDWVEKVPIAGTRIAARWNEAIAAGPGDLRQKIEPHFRTAAAWLLGQVGSVTMLILQFLLTVIICAIMFARGEVAAAGLIGFFRRLAGAHGENVVILAGRAIQSVALGVVLTALIQSVLGGIGFAVAGIPFPGLLTAFMFVLAVAQIGPGPILIGGVAWMYWTSDSAWAPTALLVWCLFVGAIDNVLRPILIQRSGDLPLLIVFAGVVGGILSFGLVGIFIGPVVLAVVYTLLKAWVATDAPQAP